ncbi:hypothetical protein C0581_00740 [Candidatus Parcubacteria bacterium]|nr:MAG: hypothetical protein C0581_00740 [Candidatus Parcubacteria bacterium]
MKNKIIAITGPTGSGKSTVSKALCKKFKKCVRLDIDRIKHLIERGFVYDNSSEGKAQWALLSKNIIDLCKNFTNEGYDIIIEGYIDLESPGWPEILSELDVKYRFLLLPDPEVIKMRDKTRVEDFQMGDDAVMRHYKYFSTNANAKVHDFVILDTSRKTIKETIEEIYK